MGHPVFARFYGRAVAPSLQREGMDLLRRRLLDGLRGTVVEVGAGEGANLALYPGAVERVVAVEPEPYLRARAVARAVPRVEVLDGRAQSLPVGDGEADAVVFCLVLCTVPLDAALAEARRVLRPGGEVRFLEHVQDPEPGARRRAQRVLDATVWPLLGGGCHLSRDPVAALAGAGFEVTEVDRFRFPEGARGPSALSALGRATAT
jgi:ubiquinone/menaquinone biosynthesis C-methylase UbiE